MTSASAETAGSPAGKWIPTSANTWVTGKWRVYRSLLPKPVYWVSKGRSAPKRIEDRDEVIRMVSQ